MVGDSLLLYDLMDGDLIPGVHLVKLVNTEEQTPLSQGPGLDDEIPALLIPHNGDRQTHSAGSLVAGVHCAGLIIGEIFKCDFAILDTDISPLRDVPAR